MIPWLNEKCIVMAMAEALDIVINVIASKVDIDQWQTWPTCIYTTCCHEQMINTRVSKPCSHIVVNTEEKKDS